MKKMLILAMTMAMVLLAAAGVCETLRVGMECNYAPYNWTQSDASENAVAIAAGGYADGYDVRIAKIIADQLGMELEIVKTEWDGLTPALLSGNIDVIIAGMSPTAERRMTIDFTDSYYDTELTVVVRKDSVFAGAKSLADLAGAKITGDSMIGEYFRVFVSYAVITVALVMYEAKKRKENRTLGQQLAIEQKAEEEGRTA